MNNFSVRDKISLAADALGPWIFQFRVGEETYGGSLDSTQDARIPQFFSFIPEAKTILELGALEGSHTFRLASSGHVQRVVAIEGRYTNLRKAELVRQLLGITRVEFVNADLEVIDVRRLGYFDAIFASGILYHLAKPWLLLRQLTTVAPKLFLWTHYCSIATADKFLSGYHGCLYTEGGLDDPLSGLCRHSFWFTRASLFAALHDAGYSKIEVMAEDVHHREGPTITLTAECSGPYEPSLD